ncbi:stage V sporulation protein AE [Evansella caseinilytica]|uniref:Stage V sporulation protein AE n=1 Tax=Evansella caseinilytica TaxID=1503961 RepID=A0A1H3L7X7_9BACI|nr:stage V sporulation protein AE [Evansella caseinilytica]SDY59995.1 stage V sporulation protein AE [Evansella caseinilytica]
MKNKKRVILITDGDASARQAAEHAAKVLNCAFIGESSGNPTKITGSQLLNLIIKAENDPVIVMFDDCGYPEEGPGEAALKTIALSPHIQVLGAVAVASQSFSHEWTRVDISIDRNGVLTEYGVDKNGIKDTELGRIRGDTVYVLDELPIPFVVGIGDIGKMGGNDTVEHHAPITTKAIQLILERSGEDGASP